MRKTVVSFDVRTLDVKSVAPFNPFSCDISESNCHLQSGDQRPSVPCQTSLQFSGGPSVPLQLPRAVLTWGARGSGRRALPRASFGWGGATCSSCPHRELSGRASWPGPLRRVRAVSEEACRNRLTCTRHRVQVGMGLSRIHGWSRRGQFLCRGCGVPVTGC